MGVVSLGGAFRTAIMLASGEENPLYAEQECLFEILDEHKIVLSLGDGMRPGSYVDSMKFEKLQEYLTLRIFVRIAHIKGVQRMIEGPVHIDYNEISYNVEMIKEITDFALLHLLDLQISDVAPDYDHIIGAIGCAAATVVSTDFLCMVSPSEHPAFPNTQNIIEGTRIAKIAAHIGDLSHRHETELP
jgi:phosphomethylpyrimidine synthase